MEFCPTCANLLQYEMANPARFFCGACPYVCPIERKVEIKRKAKLLKKEATTIAVGDKQDARSNANVPCPQCRQDNVKYEEMQTRSGDEAATIFFECLNIKCKHRWQEG